MWRGVREPIELILECFYSGADEAAEVFNGDDDQLRAPGL